MKFVFDESHAEKIISYIPYFSFVNHLSDPSMNYGITLKTMNNLVDLVSNSIEDFDDLNLDEKIAGLIELSKDRFFSPKLYGDKFTIENQGISKLLAQASLVLGKYASEVEYGKFETEDKQKRFTELLVSHRMIQRSKDAIELASYHYEMLPFEVETYDRFEESKLSDYFSEKTSKIKNWDKYYQALFTSFLNEGEIEFIPKKNYNSKINLLPFQKN